MAIAQGFSIIIPTYNRAELLRTALDSVQRLQVPHGWEVEILVIDNNSTDHTSDVAEEAAQCGPLRVRRIFEPRQGLNHARNRGLAEARFEHLVYLDDDMQVDPGWLEGFVEALESFSLDCVVGPVEPWFEELPGEWMTQRMIDSVTSAYSRKGDQLVQIPSEHRHEIPGCNFAVLRTAARDAGGFHPALDRCGAGMLGGGDWEFGKRLVLLRKRVVYSPRCRIRHFISWKKLSHAGLRARRIGGGATGRIQMRLHGEDLPLKRRLRLITRMGRFFGRSVRYRLAGDVQVAFHWELEALYLLGFLFKAPHELPPRECLAIGITKDEVTANDHPAVSERASRRTQVGECSITENTVDRES